MRLDLHVHSTASDGAISPTEVVRAAGWGELDTISLTDHDTVAGVEEAVRAGREAGIGVIPGIEVSSTWEGREIHVLGYFVDPTGPAIRKHVERALGLREWRAREILRRLGDAGIEIPFEAVVDAAGPEASAIGRPHIAKAMVTAGVVPSIDVAFNEWIGDQHPAFVPTDLGSPEDAIRTILDSGGIPVWAHPPGDLVETLLPAMLTAGLRGLEVYRPRHQPRDLRFYGEIAEGAGLLATGGSDWHSEDRNGALGTFSVGRDEVGRLLDEGGW